MLMKPLQTTVLADASMNFGERALYGFQVLLIGMCTVFLSLCALWLVIEIFHRIISRQPKEKKGTQPEILPLPADAIPQPPAAPQTESKAAPTVADDGAVVAAITAAIATMLEEQAGDPVGFRVVSFRRSASPRAWNSKK